MSKKIKALEIEALRKAFGGVKDYVIVEPLKVDSATEYEFRKNLREKQVRVQLVKNSYAKKVFGEMGIAIDDTHWAGPTLLCWGGANIKSLSNAVDEQVKAAKKDPKAPDKFKFKTAVSDGQPITIEEAKKRPTREEAIGEIVAAILAPGANLASLLTSPASELAGILKTIEEKAPKESEAAPAAEAPATPA
jgi:large subunit ribosomal protein L10